MIWAWWLNSGPELQSYLVELSFRQWFSMAQALSLCNLKLDGVHHRGIDDARNMARLAPYIFGSARAKI